MGARKHLRRLDRISIEFPVYFITICVAKRGGFSIATRLSLFFAPN